MNKLIINERKEGEMTVSMLGVIPST